MWCCRTSPGALAATRATLERLAELDVAVVIPGHGQPFTGVAAALRTQLPACGRFAADPVRMARHALKAMLVFTLLERNRLPLSKLSALMDDVPASTANTTTPIFRADARALGELLVAGAGTRGSGRAQRRVSGCGRGQVGRRSALRAAS